MPPGRNCAYCHKLFVGSERAPSLSSFPHPSGSCKVTYLEMINSVIPELSSMFPNFEHMPIPNDNYRKAEWRFLCCPCAKKIYDAYKAVQGLKKLRSEQSLIYSHCKVTVVTPLMMASSSLVQQPQQPSVENPMKKLQQQPPPVQKIVPKIPEMWKVQKRRTAIINKVKYEAYRELRNFTKRTEVLKSSPEGGTDDPVFSSRDKQLEKELKELCPTLLELMYGIFSRNPKKRQFTPAMRTAVCLAAFNMCSKCNAFQKNVGLTMHSWEAPVKLYRMFGDLGLSVAYVTARRVEKDTEEQEGVCETEFKEEFDSDGSEEFEDDVDAMNDMNLKMEVEDFDLDSLEEEMTFPDIKIEPGAEDPLADVSSEVKPTVEELEIEKANQLKTDEKEESTAAIQPVEMEQPIFTSEEEIGPQTKTSESEAEFSRKRKAIPHNKDESKGVESTEEKRTKTSDEDKPTTVINIRESTTIITPSVISAIAAARKKKSFLCNQNHTPPNNK